VHGCEYICQNSICWYVIEVSWGNFRNLLISLYSSSCTHEPTSLLLLATTPDSSQGLPAPACNLGSCFTTLQSVGATVVKWWKLCIPVTVIHMPHVGYIMLKAISGWRLSSPSLCPALSLIALALVATISTPSRTSHQPLILELQLNNSESSGGLVHKASLLNSIHCLRAGCSAPNLFACEAHTSSLGTGLIPWSFGGNYFKLLIFSTLLNYTTQYIWTRYY
jgi:hypothetical protein